MDSNQDLYVIFTLLFSFTKCLPLFTFTWIHYNTQYSRARFPNLYVTTLQVVHFWMLCLLLTWTPRYRHSHSTEHASSARALKGKILFACFAGCCHNFSDKQPRITFTTCKDDDEIARTSFFRLGIDQRCWGESSLSLLQLHFCSGIMHRPLLLSFTQNTRNSVLPTKYYRRKTSTHSRNKLKI